MVAVVVAVAAASSTSSTKNYSVRCRQPIGSMLPVAPVALAATVRTLAAWAAQEEAAAQSFSATYRQAYLQRSSALPAQQARQRAVLQAAPEARAPSRR